MHEAVFKKETNPYDLFPFELFLYYNSKGCRKDEIKYYEIIN